ncbi:MAG: GDCCVxC domain-containing (seleno)protein [Vicinamibacterales bacterium]
MTAHLLCPHCGTVTAETMPEDRCIYFWECPQCRALLSPKAGDCCVFCSYGDAECPPEQLARCGYDRVPPRPTR